MRGIEDVSDVDARGLTRRDVVVKGSIGGAGLLGLVLAAPAAAREALGTFAGATPRVVKVTLGTKANEFKLIPSVRVLPAGRVTFVVRNGGKLHHELVVLRTKIAAAKLPMRPGGKQAKEVGALGEIKAFAPGQTKRLTLTLKRGHHVLLCNVPGHYMAGQYADLTVK